jgi:hypothetical protein
MGILGGIIKLFLGTFIVLVVLVVVVVWLNSDDTPGNRTANQLSGTPEATIMRSVGDSVVQMGLATSYKLNAWEGSLDFHIPSMLPEDARLVAGSACDAANMQKPKFERTWTVRGYLVVGDRPAGLCTVQ